MAGDGLAYSRFPCWHCSHWLWTANYKLLADPLGNQVRVHRECKPDAEESLRRVTARENEWPEDWRLK